MNLARWRVAARMLSVSKPGITINVVSGSLFLYGATADNRTNDPAL